MQKRDQHAARPGSIHLVLGGARSGKTAFAEAEARACASDRKPFYLATGQAFDDEMKLRIERHRKIRGDHFDTLEEPVNIAARINALKTGDILLIDSIGTWITNLMMNEADIETALADCVDALKQCQDHGGGQVLMVSDETGLGIVPDNAMARQFRDHVGLFNQRVAAIANRVVLVVAGLPVIIKDTPKDHPL